MNDKIISLQDSILISNSKKKTVLVGGCFDIFHYGHLSFLLKAKEEGDFLVIALESDEFISKRKNKEPVHTQSQRAQILAALEIVDMVIKLPFLKKHEEYGQLVQKTNPAVIAVTAGDKNIHYKIKHAEAVGAEVKVVTSLLPTYSTSNIITSYEAFFGN